MMSTQPQISLKQAALPSLGLVLLGVLIWAFSGIELSLSGNLFTDFSSARIPAVILSGGLLGIVIYVITFYLTGFLFTSIPSLRDLFTLLRDLFANLSWPGIILLSCSAGIGEELLVRGLLQTTLVSYLGSWAGVLIASLIFGIMHAISLTYVVVTFLLGLVFGLLFLVTESLALVMVAHIAYDILAFAVIVKFPSVLKLS